MRSTLSKAVIRNFTFILALVCVVNTITAQSPRLSDKAQISVLTCASADFALYAAFGHTAFRVQDPAVGLDLVYNYGTFDFNKPNFYLNFARGKLVYSLSRTSFERFLYVYEFEKRWVKEQILDLDSDEKQQLFAYLENNYKPGNRDYLYDPLFENCSTITGSILEKLFHGQVSFQSDHLKKEPTLRQLVMEFIPHNSWGAFGINLAFGTNTDQEASARQHMFLPYYAMYQLNNTTLDGHPLVLRERMVLDYPDHKYHGTFLTTPLFWFILLFCYVLVISYVDHKYGYRNKILDFILFLISGLAGLLILFLWLATDHKVTVHNFNWLWLVPAHVFVAFHLLMKDPLPKWMAKYLLGCLVAIGLIIIIWLFGIQGFSPVFLPIVAIMAIRYLVLLKSVGYKKA